MKRRPSAGTPVYATVNDPSSPALDGAGSDTRSRSDRWVKATATGAPATWRVTAATVMPLPDAADVEIQVDVAQAVGQHLHGHRRLARNLVGRIGDGQAEHVVQDVHAGLTPIRVGAGDRWHARTRPATRRQRGGVQSRGPTHLSWWARRDDAFICSMTLRGQIESGAAHTTVLSPLKTT